MTTLTIRIGTDTERALDSLVRTGRTRSEAVRQAILNEARAQRRARLRAEAESLAHDPEDVTASLALATEMADVDDAMRAVLAPD